MFNSPKSKTTHLIAEVSKKLYCFIFYGISCLCECTSAEIMAVFIQNPHNLQNLCNCVWLRLRFFPCLSSNNRGLNPCIKLLRSKSKVVIGTFIIEASHRWLWSKQKKISQQKKDKTVWQAFLKRTSWAEQSHTRDFRWNISPGL